MSLKIKILIVDDDETNQFIIREMLEDEECVFKEAMSGEEALEILRSFCPDIILLDIMMPGMNGYEFCRKIRGENAYRFVKVIMVSGKAYVEERLEGYEAGADDYLTKPFNSEELLAKIKVYSKLKKSEEVDQIKTTLLYLFSHETRTPLNGILGGVQLLSQKGGLAPDQEHYLAMIRTSAERLEKGFKEVAFLCELKGQIDLRPSMASLADRLGKLVGEADKGADKECAFSLECPADLKITTDWALLTRVIRYVLDNAVNFSPPGGTIFVSAHRGDNNCEISIRDQGKGIESERLPRIFDEFAIDDIMHHHKGLGLSLAICRHIMDHLGGNLEAQSTPGNGATFIFRVP